MVGSSQISYASSSQISIANGSTDLSEEDSNTSISIKDSKDSYSDIEDKISDDELVINLSDDAHIVKSEKKDVVAEFVAHRTDNQTGGYPADCGTKTYKFLSYAKVLRDRGLTHPMQYSTTQVDAVGNPRPEKYPLSINFGAHAFYSLPTDSVVLSQYGIGMTLYFKFLKVMAWLFFLLVVISTPACFVYIIGSNGVLDEFKILLKQNAPSVLGMTTIGHLKSSSSTCDQASEGDVISLTCLAGEIGFVKAIYSKRETQGTCTCPERNKVDISSGNCRGEISNTCNQAGRSCKKTCLNAEYGCFEGKHPISQIACCADEWDPRAKIANFSNLMIRSTKGCSSATIQEIAEGFCLNRTSCSFPLNEDAIYTWDKSNSQTVCSNKSTGPSSSTVCIADIKDGSDFSTCPERSSRGAIIYARCFTAQSNILHHPGLDTLSEWIQITRSGFLGFAIGMDIISSLIFLSVVIWLQSKEHIAIDRISQSQIVAANYTVQLMDLPGHSDLEQLRSDIIIHLEHILTRAPAFAEKMDQIRIADVQFGKTSSGQLHLLRQRGSTVRKLEIEMQRLEKVKQLEGKLDTIKYERCIQKHIKQSKKLDNELHRHDNKLDKWRRRHEKAANAKAVTAFITFEEEEGYNRCLHEYRDLGVLHRFFQAKHKRLHGKRLIVRRAPDPSDIKWGNLHHLSLERLFRRWVVNLITLSLLLLTFALIYMTKYEKAVLDRKIGRTATCPAVVTKEEVVQDENRRYDSNYVYKALMECYCEGLLQKQSFQQVINEPFITDSANGKTEQYCKKWAKSFAIAHSLSVASVLMIVGVNLLLSDILEYLVRMEKYHTESEHVASLVTKTFFAQLCNTALLVVVINANVEYFRSHASTRLVNLSSFNVLNGKYDDFNSEWYQDVGVSIMLTMIINIVTPHLQVVLTYLTLEVRRWWDRGCTLDHTISRQDTQRDLEDMYCGPKFDLGQRYAQNLTTIFITYLFSAGMPLLHVVGLCSILLTYWADKFTFLRITRSPPQYDGKIARVTSYLLPYAVLLHSLLAIWMFSYKSIFQTDADIQKDFKAPKSEAIGEDIPPFGSIADPLFGRLTRRYVVVLFIFFCMISLYIVLRMVFIDYLPSAMRTVCPALSQVFEEPKRARGIPSYFDAIPTMILREKVQCKRTKPDLQAKYQAALERRLVSSTKSSPGSVTGNIKIRRKTFSAAEQYNDEKWIVGCHSYSIADNKEYIRDLAIDSIFSEGIQLDQIL